MDNEIDIERFRLTPEALAKWHAALAKCRADRITSNFQKMAAEMTRGKEFELWTLPYRQFLKTTYWYHLSRYIKLLHKDKCDHCGRCFDLQVHHLTYGHVGSEYLHLNDLAVLCDGCHRAEHGR